MIELKVNTKYLTRNGTVVELLSNANPYWPFKTSGDFFYHDAETVTYEGFGQIYNYKDTYQIVSYFEKTNDYQSPVRVKTVKEIVSGTYGFLDIYAEDNGSIRLECFEEDLTAVKVRDMVRVLTDVLEFLEQ